MYTLYGLYTRVRVACIRTNNTYKYVCVYTKQTITWKRYILDNIRGRETLCKPEWRKVPWVEQSKIILDRQIIHIVS